MKTFIKVIEIWTLDKTRTYLEFHAGLYGALTAFKAASEPQIFAYNQGLPGKAWAQGRPLILTQLQQSYFKRLEAAQTAGLTCAIALPIFAGDFLMAVVVFLCGDDTEHAGAIEVWSDKAQPGQALNLLTGYYGTLNHFEQVSKTLEMPKNSGLPGLAWAKQLPVLIEDIGQNGAFLRALPAQLAGITMGIALPLIDANGTTYIMTFLSAKTTPIAKRIQIWIPNAEGTQLICQGGYSKQPNELAQLFETVKVNKGEGALGRVWLSGMPQISGDQALEYHPGLDNLSSMLAIPVIIHGRLKAIASFLF